MSTTNIARKPKALVPLSGTAAITDPSEWQIIKEQASIFITSGLLPAHIKSPEAAIAIMIKGRELGVPPMQALCSIVVVQGKPTCNAELMLALDYRDHGDDAIIITETTAERCTISYKRRGWKERQEYAFTMEDARRAGLAETQTWKKYPQAMLRARAISAVSRMAFPDSIAGMYVYEEMGLAVDVEGGEQVVVVEHDPGGAAQPQHEASAEAERHSPERRADSQAPSGSAARGPQGRTGAPGSADGASFAQRAGAALGPSDGPSEANGQVGLGELRAAVIALLERDGAALDLLKAKGTLPADMTAEQVRKAKDWLLERERRNVPLSVRLGRSIDGAATSEALRAAQQAVQQAKDAKGISQVEYVGLLQAFERRRTELSGPLTSGVQGAAAGAQA